MTILWWCEKRNALGSSAYSVCVAMLVVMMMSAWAMMMVRVAVDDVGFRRGDAAIDRGAVGDLDLDG